jgi:hypothetical protein
MRLQPPAQSGSSLADFFTLKMEAIRSSETSVHTRSTLRHIPDDCILRKISGSHNGDYKEFYLLKVNRRFGGTYSLFKVKSK